MARHRRIRAICSGGRIWPIRAMYTSAEIGTRLAREIPAGQAGLVSGERGAFGPAQQSGRSEIGRAAAGGLQSDSLSGAARAVHGFHLQLDRQIALDHGLRQRRRADQRPVQRAAAGDRYQQCAGLGHCHGLRGIHHRRRPHWSEVPHGSRQQHAGARAVVPHARVRARSCVSNRSWLFRKTGRSRSSQAARC